MASPLQRLYRTKLTLLAVILTVAGVGLLVADSTLAHRPGWTWLHGFKLVEIGVALLSGGALAVLLQYVGKRDLDEELRHELRQAIRSEAPAIRDAVVDGFAFAPDSLTSVASPETLDKIVENTLGLRLGDAELAHDSYRSLQHLVSRSDERCYDSKISIALSPWSPGPNTGHGSMFVATIRMEYRTNAAGLMRFACLSDLDEQRELLDDPHTAVAWYFEPVAGIKASDREAFELVSVSVDGMQLHTRRVIRAGAQTYTATLDSSSAGKAEHMVSYTFQVLVQRHGHLLHLDLSKLTKRLKIDFAYGGCGIQHVNVIDYFGSSQRPRITRLPASAPTPTISISFDGWVVPRSGVGFVWVNDELAAVASRR